MLQRHLLPIPCCSDIFNSNIYEPVPTSVYDLRSKVPCYSRLKWQDGMHDPQPAYDLLFSNLFFNVHVATQVPNSAIDLELGTILDSNKTHHISYSTGSSLVPLLNDRQT